MNVTDRIRERAQGSPEAHALIRPNGTPVSYRQVDRAIDCIAGRARELGLRAGALVGVPTPDAYRSLLIRLALARIGIGTASNSIDPQSLDASLEDERVWPDKEALAKTRPVPSREDGRAVLALFPTSGTDGQPKHVALTHEQAASRLTVAIPTDGLSGPVREMCTVGAATSYGFLSRLRVLWNGGVVVMAPPTTTQMIQRMTEARVNRLVAPPMALAALARGAQSGARPTSLEQVETSGSAMPGPVYELAREVLCGNIISRYGATETGYVASAPLGLLRNRSGAVGYVDPRITVQAVDAAGKVLPAGTEGTLRVKSAGCASGYFRDAESSSRIFRDGWVYPGDMGSVAADGLLSISGRESDVINQSGVKVSPQVIEEVQLSSGEVSDAAAFGVSNAMGIVVIWAAIVPRGPVDFAALAARCREQLGRKAPARFLELKEVPRNESGKVLRRRLVEMAKRATVRPRPRP